MRALRLPPRICLAAVTLCLASLGLVASAAADPRSVTTHVDDDAQAIYHEYMSPYCPGLLLANCPSPAAEALRHQIEATLRTGTPADEIRATLERRFGDRILAAPAAHGFGLVAWLVPVLFVLTGGAVVAAWLRVHARPVVAPSPPVPTESYSPAILARLEDELRAALRR